MEAPNLFLNEIDSIINMTCAVPDKPGTDLNDVNPARFGLDDNEFLRVLADTDVECDGISELISSPVTDISGDCDSMMDCVQSDVSSEESDLESWIEDISLDLGSALTELMSDVSADSSGELSDHEYPVISPSQSPPVPEYQYIETQQHMVISEQQMTAYESAQQKHIIQPQSQPTRYEQNSLGFDQSCCVPQVMPQQEEERKGDQKPVESYVAMVAKALLSVPSRQLVLKDIYDWLLDQYPYFRSAKCAWRSSVRHALSTNECFMKSGRSPNGRGFMWAIHPLCLEDFIQGDFNRRQARRRVQHMTRQMETPQNSTSLNDYNSLPQTYHQPATVPSYTPMSSSENVLSYGHTYTPMSSSPNVISNNMYNMYMPMNTSFVLPSSSSVHRFNEITSQLSKDNGYHNTFSTAMTATCS